MVDCPDTAYLVEWMPDILRGLKITEMTDAGFNRPHRLGSYRTSDY